MSYFSYQSQCDTKNSSSLLFKPLFISKQMLINTYRFQLIPNFLAPNLTYLISMLLKLLTILHFRKYEDISSSSNAALKSGNGCYCLWPFSSYSMNKIPSAFQTNVIILSANCLRFSILPKQLQTAFRDIDTFVIVFGALLTNAALISKN